MGQSYEEADAVAGSLINVFGAFVPPKCRSVALQLICLSALPVCQIGTTLSRKRPRPRHLSCGFECD